MGHSHSHDHPHVEVGTLARRVLVGFLAALAVLTVAGLIWLWPTSGEIAAGSNCPSQLSSMATMSAEVWTTPAG
ncbi:hypothetical protein Q0P05_14340, partial [Staphylococcus aureus]|nr:hypothetical protein [Staphylococcus aureus]